VITLFDETGTVEGLAQLLTELELQPLVRGVLILAAEGNGFTPETVDALLGASALPLMGGIFPLVIFKGRHYIQGTVVCGIDVMPEVVVIPGMSDPDMDFEYYLEKEFYPTCKRGTLWLWVDGLATRTEALLRGWFNLYGLDYNVIGGGAGSASFKPMPCLFTNDGLLQDKAVIALLDMPSGVGVSHGWQSVNGPFRVTETEGKAIKSLDWQPAITVYRKVVKKATGEKLTAENFGELATRFPFGINRFGSDKIVRDPIILRSDGALVCLGDVPGDAYVEILTGSHGSLIDASVAALAMAHQNLGFGEQPRTALLIDCVTRARFLGDRYGDELAALVTPDITLVGALTLGEIANSGKDLLELYNRTSVVGLFG
jgi:hypothetical protein